MISTPFLSDILRWRLTQSIPRILCLLDKNPLSPSYGCFDRKYWQYKILDFPSGMQQELVRPLAWAYLFADAPWRGNERLKEYALAGIRATASMAHSDGALDDYFPYERALGATAYALAAVTDTCRLLDWTPDSITLAGLRRMGHFLAEHRESGMLANHHAIAANALYDLSILCNDAQFRCFGERKIRLLATMQHKDGWFPEYEGCDPGYQTVTLEFLARCEANHPGSVPVDVLKRLVTFLNAFVHPDGSLGGEYGSRNTYNFYPGGFALLSPDNDESAEILGMYTRSISGEKENHLEDDGTFGHMLSSYVTALTKPCRVREKKFEECLPYAQRYADAELLLAGTGSLRLFGNLTKGGAFKIFRGDTLICSDTGYAGKLEDGRLFSQNMPGASQADLHNNADEVTIKIQGSARRPARQRLTPLSLFCLRGLCLALGRFRWFSQGIRRIMQALLIYRKKTVPVTFSRTVHIDRTGLRVNDTVTCHEGARFKQLYLTPDDVSIHVVTSDAFQFANLQSWIECLPENGQSFKMTRFFPAEEPQGECL